MVNGVLYASNGLGLAEAFDPANGHTIWSQQPPPEGLMGGTAAWCCLPCRRAVLAHPSPTRGTFYALDAKTGELTITFGENVRYEPRTACWSVDAGLAVDVDARRRPRRGGDGSSMVDQDSQEKREGIAQTRAPTTCTPAGRWTFRIIPRPGEEGNDTLSPTVAHTAPGNVVAHQRRR